jgi:DNA polymerase family A
MELGGISFAEVWLADFEFSAPPGNRPTPICMVAHEIGSGQTIKLFGDELHKRNRAPYCTGPDSLFVAYFASAEFSCHLTLGWPLPTNVLDLYAEFRNRTNGLATPAGNSLLGALAYHGIDSMKAVEKDEMRALAMRGGPFTSAEREALLAYCAGDVFALRDLLMAMLPKLDVPRAILRGRYIKAVARMEHIGTPIDADALALIKSNWENIQEDLIQRIDTFRVYEGRTFKAARFAAWLSANKIPWPRLESGKLALDDDSFEAMTLNYPQLIPLQQLRVALSEMRLADLAVGPDSRNRALISPFASRTGRNQPSNSRFIFGPAVWLRHLIRPKPGTGIAYLDYEQQEFGIAAALSGDPKMLAAYRSGDPYLEFAKQAKAAPSEATKATHAIVRELFKVAALAVQYSMEAESLARRIERSPAEARDLLRCHREQYRRFWRWSDAAVDLAMLTGRLSTVFGWVLHVHAGTNPRTLRNYPMQANGAEMLRLACCLATERGVAVCAPIHDAILIEAPLERLDATIRTAQEAMAEASRVVLAGVGLRTEVQRFRHPERYTDKRGSVMWGTVQQILAGLPPVAGLHGSFHSL